MYTQVLGERIFPPENWDHFLPVRIRAALVRLGGAEGA